MIITLDFGDVFILLMFALGLIYSGYVLIRIGIESLKNKLKGEDYRYEKSDVTDDNSFHSNRL